MKKAARILTVVLSLLMLLPYTPIISGTALSEGLIPGETVADLQKHAKALVEEEAAATAKANTLDGYTTYTIDDMSLAHQIPNTTVEGTTCSAVQGMSVEKTYAYFTKRNSDDTYVAVTRVNLDTGTQTLMDFYASSTATAPSGCNTMGHANDITVAINGSSEFLFATTTVATTAISRHQISGTKLTFTGYFDLVDTSGTSKNCSAIKYIKTSGGYFYFLLKRGWTFYTCKIATGATGGTKSAPTKVTIYKIFNIDTRNAMFVRDDGTVSTMTDVDTWTNQGFGYNHAEGVVYYPTWKSVTGNDNVIICYNIKDNIDSWLNTTSNLTNIIYPTKTNFMLNSTTTKSYELEAMGFRPSQGTSGDLNFYISLNVSPLAKEGIWKCSYKSGGGDHTPMDEGKTTYTVKYNANGGTGTTASTNHIYGIKTKLKTNAFTRSGYYFSGWQLTRNSDGKWLYENATGTTGWYTKGSQPSGYSLAVYENKQTVSALSKTDGDTVTCYAQWTAITADTKQFTVHYDANGGTGTMEDTTVIYGVSTPTAKNVFKRSGYNFVGWTAYRAAQGQWSYKNHANTAGKWFAPDEDTTGYMLKTYRNNCSLSGTTGVNGDTLTLYAAWARVKSSNMPDATCSGLDFIATGTVEATTGIYAVEVVIEDATGKAVKSYSDSVCAKKYDLSKLNINLGELATGNYVYIVSIQTVDGAAPDRHTLYAHPFEVLPQGKYFTVKYDANGGKGIMADTTVIYGISTPTTKSIFTREGYTFVGWNAHRATQNQWAYKNKATLAGKWFAPDQDTAGYLLKTYRDGCNLASTTSAAADTLTFRAAWARVKDSNVPTTLKNGSKLALAGTVEATTDIYNVSLSIKDSGGTEVASHNATPCASSYDLTAADIDLGSLTPGSYTYSLAIGTVDGSVPDTHTLLTQSFVVLEKDVLALTEAAKETGLYTLGDKYFSGFENGIRTDRFMALFENPVTLTDSLGNTVADSATIGTGYTLSCGDESRITVLIYDINCDADITSADVVIMKAMIKGMDNLKEYVTLAADGDGDGAVSTVDVLGLKTKLKG